MEDSSLKVKALFSLTHNWRSLPPRHAELFFYMHYWANKLDNGRLWKPIFTRKIIHRHIQIGQKSKESFSADSSFTQNLEFSDLFPHILSNAYRWQKTQAYNHNSTMMFSNCPASHWWSLTSWRNVRSKKRTVKVKYFLIKVQLTDLAHFHAAHLQWVYTTTAYWPH